MRVNRYKLFLLFFIKAFYSFSQTNQDSILEKIKEDEDYQFKAQNILSQNPASKLYARKYNLTQLKTNLVNENNNYYLKQNGKDLKLWSVSVFTDQNLNNTTQVWGNANYKQGTRKSIQWNETSDYEKIYPYVVADSIGGDIQFEHYSFSGGYAKKINSFTLGVEGHYHAKMEYRRVDPRPKNISTDINFILGINKSIQEKWSIGVKGHIEKYTQKHHLSFHSNQGFPQVYTMTGLGNYNALLSGKPREAYYEGWTYGVGMQAFENKKRDWYIDLGIKTFLADKVMPGFTNLKSSEIKQNYLYVNIAKMYKTTNFDWGLVLRTSKLTRKGIESLFSNDISSNFTTLGKLERYKNEVNNIKINGILIFDNSRNKHSFSPQIQLSQEHETYSYPFSEVKLGSMSYGINYQWFHTLKNNSFFILNTEIAAKNLYEKKAIFNTVRSEAILEMLMNNYQFQSANNINANAEISYHFRVPILDMMFVRIRANYVDFNPHHNFSFNSSVGINF